MSTSESLPGTQYKISIESRESEKASKMKGRVERQLKGQKAAWKNEKSKGLRSKKLGKMKTEPFQVIYFHILMSRLCCIWRDIRG
jgi:hypothetical protein